MFTWIAAAWLCIAHAQTQQSDIDFGYTPNPEPGEKPAIMVTPRRTVKELFVQVEAGGQTYTFTRKGVIGGNQARFSWTRDESVTTAEVFVRAVFPDGFVEEANVSVDWSFHPALSVKLDGAVADVEKRTLTVTVTAPVERAEITALGAHRDVLDESQVEIGAGPGRIVVPWVGDPGRVVLLDVTLYSGNAWAGFSYSPWFLDIPHDDVNFATNSSEIPADEEWKLTHTLEQLQDVLTKYGSVVPVKLYVAGCTDTVGDRQHNKNLSLQRARSIARWLRTKGFGAEIWYHGFGEDLLAVPTGDGVDELSNRRALYMVGANPPPAGSGIPSVRWIPLN